MSGQFIKWAPKEQRYMVDTRSGSDGKAGERYFCHTIFFFMLTSV